MSESDLALGTPFNFPVELLKSLTFVLNKVTEGVDHHIEEVVAPHDLTFKQYSLLRFLQSEGPHAQIDISHRVGLDRTSVMRIVDALEERKLVRRDPDPNDRRKHSVVVTKLGSELIKRCAADVRQAELELYASLSKQEQAQLLSLLRRLLLGQDS